MEGTIVSLFKFWNGKQSIGKAFWGLFLPAIIILLYLQNATASLLLRGNILFVLLFTLVLLVSFYAWVSLWRCAANIKNEASIVFTLLARGLVIAHLLYTSMMAYIVLLGWLKY